MPLLSAIRSWTWRCPPIAPTTNTRNRIALPYCLHVGVAGMLLLFLSVTIGCYKKTSFNFSMKLKEDLSLRVKQDLLLAVHFVRNCELLTTLCTTSGQHAATVCSQHTLTETMLIVSLSVVGLECPFHCLYILFLLFVYRSAKQELPATLGNMRLQNYI